MKLLFIVNPIAGKGNTRKAIPHIQNFCDKHGFECTIIQTTKSGEAPQIVRDNCAGYSVVVAVGGDGTVLEVTNGLRGTDIPLGVIPLGSGNDFAKAVSIPAGLDNIEKSLEIISSRPAMLMDLPSFNGHVFLNIASIGFDAEIIRDLHQIKRFVKGKAAYFLSVFVKFLTYKPKDVELKLDDRMIKTKVFLTAICNGNSYGGGMLVNPNGSITDGLLDIVLIKPVPRYKIPLLLMKFIKGKHLSLPFVTTYQCRDVHITCHDEDLAVNVDGECPLTTPVSLGLTPLSMRVIGNL